MSRSVEGFANEKSVLPLRTLPMLSDAIRPETPSASAVIVSVEAPIVVQLIAVVPVVAVLIWTPPLVIAPSRPGSVPVIVRPVASMPIQRRASPLSCGSRRAILTAVPLMWTPKLAEPASSWKFERVPTRRSPWPPPGRLTVDFVYARVPEPETAPENDRSALVPVSLRRLITSDRPALVTVFQSIGSGAAAAAGFALSEMSSVPSW